MAKRWYTYFLSFWLTGLLAAWLATGPTASVPARVQTPSAARQLVPKAPSAEAVLPALSLSHVHAPAFHPLPHSFGKAVSSVLYADWRKVYALFPVANPRPVPVRLAYFRHLFRHGISINAP
ncbi:hypothetical protein [Tellurirhabdus rosea]|uniref:hypothetical protein n=1 Tax=Tellurirhabdus rosea TaxID=2674997 RepID=UPI00225947B5|nr:hypothetical protein [Tellurirhabdus rosea]